MEALEASRAAAFLAKGLKPLPFQKDESVARANQEANKAALSPANMLCQPSKQIRCDR